MARPDLCESCVVYAEHNGCGRCIPRRDLYDAGRADLARELLALPSVQAVDMELCEGISRLVHPRPDMRPMLDRLVLAALDLRKLLLAASAGGDAQGGGR